MSSHQIQAEDLVPLTPAVFHIMLSLADGEQHGYAIMQEVQRTTEGQVSMGPGTLYGTIKRMLQSGLIEESGEQIDQERGERRRFYRLTPFGRKVMGLEAHRLESVVQLARRKKILTLKGA